MSRFLAPLASVLFAFVAWPVHALGKAGIRFVHAVPGAGEAELTVEQDGRTQTVGRAGYAARTPIRRLTEGPTHWTLRAGGRTLASGRTTLGNASYTAVALPRGEKLRVTLFRDATTAPRGRARVRVIHAAAELGQPDLLVDGKPVARRLSYGKATPYLTLVPGRHDLEAVRSGTTDRIVGLEGARFAAGTTSSAIVVGTRGEPARVITVTDRAGGGREQGASTSTRSRNRGADARTSHTVERGDSLWRIAAANLGDDASAPAIAREVQRLWDLNDEAIGTGDPNLIFPGQTIRLS